MNEIYNIDLNTHGRRFDQELAQPRELGSSLVEGREQVLGGSRIIIFILKISTHFMYKIYNEVIDLVTHRKWFDRELEQEPGEEQIVSPEAQAQVLGGSRIIIFILEIRAHFTYM